MEEALDLSFDRLLMMMMMINFVSFFIYAWVIIVTVREKNIIQKSNVFWKFLVS